MSGLITPLILRVCDDEGKPTIFINLYSDLTYTERFMERSSFEFSVSRNMKNADELIPGRFVILPKDEYRQKMRLMIIKQVSVDESTITVSGCDYLWELLTYRIALYGTDEGTGTDKQTGVAETVARHFIAKNLTEATDTRRQDSNIQLVVFPPAPVGESVTIEGRFQTLAEIVETCCTVGKIGVDAELVVDDTKPTGWYLLVSFVKGTDRSQS